MYGNTLHPKTSHGDGGKADNMKRITPITANTWRITRVLALAILAVSTLVLCTACSIGKPEGTSAEEPSIFEQGTWALSTFEGKCTPDSYSFVNIKLEYNERGQIVESRKSTNSANIINGQTSHCTWADDGLSYEFSYTLTSGNCGELGDSGTSKATFEVEYDKLSATYTAVGVSVHPWWARSDDTVRYALEYRPDGTLKHKEVKGYQSEGSLEVYDYNERGDLVRYEYTMHGENTPWLIKTYDITYEEDVPKSVVATWSYATSDDDTSDDGGEDATAEDEARNVKTYEYELRTDEDGNVTYVSSDKRGLAKMSWVYVENPDPLSRLRIQAEAASPFELL